MHILQQMNRRSRQDQVSLCRLLGERLGCRDSRTHTLRQRIRHIGQRISRTASHNEFAFAQQRFRFAPFRYFGKGVNPNQKKQAIVFLQRALSRRTVSMLKFALSWAEGWAFSCPASLHSRRFQYEACQLLA